MELFDIALILQIFALVNPMASFPFLMSAFQKKMDVRLIAIKSVLVAFVIAVIITFAGPFLFDIFDISLDSFRIAGGIVLLLLGINMVRPSKEDESNKHEKINHLVAILATPLLTGPATISFITIKAFELGKASVLTNLSLAFILVGIVFYIFSLTIKKINLAVVDITSRIMGLFLTAVAIEMIAKGIQGLFAGII